MEIVNNLLLWVHLTALAAGGAAAFGIPVVGSRMPTAAPETRPLLMSIMKGLSGVGRAGIGLLIVTGPLMVWLRYDGFGALNIWFWIKMVLVVALLAGVIYGGIMMKRSAGGDVQAARMGPRIGMVNTALLLGIVFTAVFAFE